MVTCKTFYSILHHVHMSKLKNDRAEIWQASGPALVDMNYECHHGGTLRWEWETFIFSKMFGSLDASLSLLEFFKN